MKNAGNPNSKIVHSTRICVNNPYIRLLGIDLNKVITNDPEGRFSSDNNSVNSDLTSNSSSAMSKLSCKTSDYKL